MANQTSARAGIEPLRQFSPFDVVEHDGKQHKLKWAHVAGHKKRAEQRYTVVEEGEDGIIVQDAAGKRRLVTIPPEARAERLALGPQKTKP